MAASHLIEAARGLAQDRVAPALAHGDWNAAALRAEAGALGLIGVEVPARLGGGGAVFEARLGVCRALAAVDFGFAMSIVNSHNVALRLAMSDREPERIAAIVAGRTSACTAITEPDAGSDISAMRTAARPERDGWRLTGEKYWIVNARDAGLSIVYAQVEDRDGIGAFLVDLTQAGVTRYPQDSAIGQETTGTGGLVFDDVVLPPDAMILAPGSAIPAILAEINLARIYVAAMCCAMVSAALDAVAAHGLARTSFGKPLWDHQAWRLAMAQARCDCDAADALVDKATDGRDGPDVQRLAASAKVVATSCATRHLPALLHLMGARGLDPDLPLARHVGAAQVAGLVDGSTEMLLERVARAIRPKTDTNRKASS